MSALSPADRDVIEASVRRSASYATAPMARAQVDAAVALALELYAVAARHLVRARRHRRRPGPRSTQTVPG